MEDVLDLYAQEPTLRKARICFDERPCQLLEEVVAPLPMKAGKPEKQDYEYTRQGRAVILLAYVYRYRTAVCSGKTAAH